MDMITLTDTIGELFLKKMEAATQAAAADGHHQGYFTLTLPSQDQQQWSAIMFTAQSGEAQISWKPKSKGAPSSETSETIVVGGAPCLVPLGSGSSSNEGVMTYSIVSQTEGARIMYAKVPANNTSASFVRAIPLPPSEMPTIGTPRSTPAKLMERDTALRSYVDGVRLDLKSLYGKTNGLTEEQYANAMSINEQESIERGELCVAYITRVEYLERHLQEQLEMLRFAEILRTKKDSLFVPGCSGSCNYCCMTRARWAEHVDDTHTKLMSSIVTQEAAQRESISENFMALHSAIVSKLVVCVEFRQQHLSERNCQESEETHLRRDIMAEEANSFRQFLMEWGEIERSKKLLVASGELREKYLAVVKVQDGLGQQERRVLRRLNILLTEEERTSRQHLHETESVRFAEFYNRFKRACDEIEFNEWKAGVQHVLAERDELAEFKTGMEEEREEARITKEREWQEELEQEFKLIKKLKKQGPPKVPEIPPCSRCGQVPAKDAHTHRVAECPERPMMCTKCDKIIPFSQNEHHKTICPSRVLQCEGCDNYYKASYLELVHGPKCSEIKEARDTLSQLYPHFPFEFKEAPTSRRSSTFLGTSSTSSNNANTNKQGAGVKFLENTAAQTAVTNCFLPDKWVNNKSHFWRLVAISKAPNVTAELLLPSHEDIVKTKELVVASETRVHNVEDAKLFLAANAESTFLKIGEPIVVLLQPTEIHEPSNLTPLERALRPVTPPADSGEGGGNSAPITPGTSPCQQHEQWCSIPMGTSIPLQEFKELSFLVNADESNYCKPQPVSTKKGGKKK